MLLLSSAETTRLLAVLPQGDLEFGRVAQEFAGAFDAQDRFKACCAIVLLLEVRARGRGARGAGRGGGGSGPRCARRAVAAAAARPPRRPATPPRGAASPARAASPPCRAPPAAAAAAAAGQGPPQHAAAPGAVVCPVGRVQGRQARGQPLCFVLHPGEAGGALCTWRQRGGMRRHGGRRGGGAAAHSCSCRALP
jgi:hypothetical protein